MTLLEQARPAEKGQTGNGAAVPPLWRLVSRRGSVIAALNENGDGIPFYCVHSISGEVSSLFNLVRVLGGEQRFYGIQVPKDKMNGAFPTSIEAVAEHHVKALTAFQPEGPLVLGGWSAGAVLALEMARQLRALGRDVPLLVAMDGAPCNTGAGLKRRDPRYAWRLLRNLPGWVKHHVLRSDSPRAFFREIAGKIAFRVRLNLPALRTDQPLDEATVHALLNASGWQAGQQAFIRALYDAMRVYVPQPYEGRVLVYEAGTQPLDHLMQVAAIWKTIARRTEIVRLEGIHDRLLKSPAVDALSQHLRLRLTELREPR